MGTTGYGNLSDNLTVGKATAPFSQNQQAEMAAYHQNFFKNYGINPFVDAKTDPFSTFAADVDTASYQISRSFIENNLLPPSDAVRTEEFVNSFDYHYSQPLNSTFAIHTDLANSYFGDPSSKLLRVGIQGKELQASHRKPAVLTFVIDVSGSMNQQNRLDLAKQSLLLLLEQLQPQDRVSLVIYGTEATLLSSHQLLDLNSRNHLQNLIRNLRAEGSTNAEAGLQKGYQEAEKAFQAHSNNRVILISDGVANVGATGPEAILNQIKTSAQRGIDLSTYGVGLGNYNDVLLEQLANQANGQYAYIDNLDQARQLFISKLSGQLEWIAKDLKIQLQFDPSQVEQYRLLGYENRAVADKDFRNDAVDAGEVGANHSVTALYEVRFKPGALSGKIGKVSLRYQEPGNSSFKEISQELFSHQVQAFQQTSASFKLAAISAEFAEVLRGSVFAEDGSLLNVLELARATQQQQPDPQLATLITVMEKAQTLQQPLGTRSVSSPASLAAQSQNPQNLPLWQQYLLKQLGGLQSR